MPLTQLNFQPGIDIENTATGAEGKWIDCDKVRFRKGLPQKIGGWSKITSNTVTGAVRAQHQWTDLVDKKYAALETNKILVIYSEGDFY